MAVTFLTNEDEQRIVTAATAESVLFSPQILTEKQKFYARENIGAVGIADISGNANKNYEKIATITVTPDASGNLPQHVIFTADSEGNPFELRDFLIHAYAGFVDGSQSTLYMDVNRDSVIVNGAVGSIESLCRSFNIFFRLEDAGFKRVEYTSCVGSDTAFNAQAIIQQSRLIPPTFRIAEPPVTKIDLFTSTGKDKQWVEGSTFELWGVRA